MPSHYFRPASNSTRDLEAHELGMQFYVRYEYTVVLFYLHFPFYSLE